MLSSFFRIILVLQNLYRSFKAKINYTHELKYISYFFKNTENSIVFML